MAVAETPWARPPPASASASLAPVGEGCLVLGLPLREEGWGGRVQAGVGQGSRQAVWGLRHLCLKLNCQLPPGKTICPSSNGGPGPCQLPA